MKRGMEWYRREPIAFLGGVQGLTSREIAVYTITLDLLYQHGGELHNDPKWLSGWISDMGAAAVRTTINSLIEKGKLCVLPNGMLSQNRVKSEMETQGKRRENAGKTEKKRPEKSPDLDAAPNAFNDLTPLDKSREEEIRKESIPVVPSPPPKAALRSKWDNLQNRLLEANGIAAGFRDERQPGLLNLAPIIGLIEGGLGLETDILPAIRGKPNPAAKTWSYFVAQIREYAEKRRGAAGIAASIARQAPAFDWAQAADVWSRDGTWAPGWGPKPGEPGCRMPKQLTREAAA